MPLQPEAEATETPAKVARVELYDSDNESSITDKSHTTFNQGVQNTARFSFSSVTGLHVNGRASQIVQTEPPYYVVDVAT